MLNIDGDVSNGHFLCVQWSFLIDIQYFYFPLVKLTMSSNMLNRVKGFFHAFS